LSDQATGPIADRRELGFFAQKIEILESRLVSNPLHSDPNLPALYDQYAAKESLKTKVRGLKKKIQAAHSVMHLDELRNRKRTLRRLGFATQDDVVEQKGRVACEISSGDELLLTEMVFGGVFNDLTPQQCAALLSCFVFDEKVRRSPFRSLSRESRSIC
jgi:ATP-dependent RNA helicase DOB1